MNNRCPVCEIQFYGWLEYNKHKAANKCFKKVQPVRTTTRSVARIIHDMEKIWGHAVMPMVHPWDSLPSGGRAGY